MNIFQLLAILDANEQSLLYDDKKLWSAASKDVPVRIIVSTPSGTTNKFWEMVKKVQREDGGQNKEAN